MFLRFIIFLVLFSIFIRFMFFILEDIDFSDSLDLFLSGLVIVFSLFGLLFISIKLFQYEEKESVDELVHYCYKYYDYNSELHYVDTYTIKPNQPCWVSSSRNGIDYVCDVDGVRLKVLGYGFVDCEVLE